MQSLKTADAHGKKRPSQVIPLSDQIFRERGGGFRRDISLLPKILHDFVRVKRQHDFLPAGLHEGKNIGLPAIRRLLDRPRTAPEASVLLPKTEKARRLPKCLGNAELLKFFWTPEII